MQKPTILLRLILSVVAVSLIIIAILVGTSTVRWVGHTDATVRFVVIDAASGVPLADAQIQINTDTPKSRLAPQTPQFLLTTNGKGEADYRFHQLRCSGGRGWFENSYNLALPNWEIRVTSPHCEPRDDVRLVSSETQRQVGPGMHDRVIIIPVRLKRVAN